MTETQVLIFLGTAALKATAILVAAALVNSLWRSASAAARHLVWTVGVASALTLPLLSAAIERLGAPRLEIPAWTPSPAPAGIRPSEGIVRATDPLVIAPTNESIIQSNAPIIHTSGDAAVESGYEGTAIVDRATASPKVDTPEPAGAATVEPATVSRGYAIAGTLDYLLKNAFYLWLAGAVLALLPLAAAMLRVRILEKRSRRASDASWFSIIERTPAVSHLATRVRIMENDDATMPMTWGIVHPTLLVPASSERWPEWQRRNILLHELAHVERRDCLTQLMAHVACAVYWFNPLVWVAAQRMRVERELACDDRVISAGSKASDYAANLLEVARSLRAPSYTSHTAIAMARPSQLSGRLLAVLDSKRNRRSVTRRVAAGIGFTTIAVAVLLSVITPGAQAATISESFTLPANEVPAAISEAPMSFSATTTLAEPSLSIVKAAQIPAIGIVASAAANSPASALGTLPRVTSALPLLQFQDGSCWTSGDGDNSSVSINNNDNNGRSPSWNVRYSRPGCSMELRAEGKFTLRPDLSDLESIDRDGWFRVEETVGRNSKRVEIRRGSNGDLDHQYWVNGDRTPYNNEARAWLAQILLGVERRTAFAADTRVPQLYRTGGLRAVLSEIALMPSPYAKSRYYGSLLDMDVKLDANTLNNVVRQVGQDMRSSDYYMSEVLGKFAKQPAANEATWRAFAEAAGTMKSDYYKQQTFKTVLSKGQLSDETVGILLKSTANMKSDYYLSELLKNVSSKYALNAQTRPYYVDALRRIESDYYRGEVLKTLGTEGDWDARTSSLVLASVADIKSDYYRSESLVSLVKSRHVADWNAWYNAAATIASDYYKRETVLAALKQRPLERPVVLGALNVATRMKSDSEIAEILNYITKNYKIDDAVRPAFEKAVDAIDSDYYRGSVLNAMRRNTSTY